MLLGAGCDQATTGGGSTPDAGLTAQENDIRDAVEAMRERGENATVLVTDRTATPYVKLSSDGSDIVANLPLQWLDDTQLAAARTVFADAGAAGSQLPSRNAATDMFPEFDVTLGKDPDRAARFVAELLEEVYAVAPTDDLVFENDAD